MTRPAFDFRGRPIPSHLCRPPRLPRGMEAVSDADPFGPEWAMRKMNEYAIANLRTLSARIVIERYVTADDVIDHVEAVTSDGDTLPLTEALGMLRLAEDTLIRERMGEDE